ncbi:MAG: hypothetical protein KJ070_20325 [Verrucomicrobia bacterium]|nr:hypothetical protein [Verrucomicrobiota bacterium]
MRLPTGAVITNEFDPDTGLLLAVKDGDGNVVSATAYNGLGLPITESDAFGSLNYTYDATGNLAHMTNGLGQVVSSLYDPNGNLTNLVNGSSTTTVAYDAMNRETMADYGNIEVSYGFEGEGDWTSADGPTLGHMERKMDDQGRLAGWETANGSTPGFAYDVNGRLEYETNSIGVVSRTVYNEAGWVRANTNLATGAWAAYGYDAAGQRTVVTNALGFATRYAYYPSGSLKAMTNAFGTNFWQYSDAAGACAGCGNAVSVTDPIGRITESIASPYGLPVSTIWRSGSLVSSNFIEYLDGLTTPEQEAEEYPVAITDEGARTRRYDYDGLGRLYRATDLSGGTWWTNQFDPTNGALLAVISPTAETNSYVYDDLDNVKAIRFSDNNWLTNFYNLENRLSGARLPSGVSLTNHYDFAGRLTNRSSTIGETASFEYNGNDAVTKMTDNTGSTTNLYDAAGRLWGIDYPWGGSVRYGLDLLDRITAITNKASSGGTAYVTRYQYDPVGNVTNVIDPFNGNTTFEYDRVGRKTKRTLPNNVVTEWQYDWRDRVTNITHKVGNSVLASVLYERTPGGEPTKITREDGTYVGLKYDAAWRLTNEVFYASGGTPQTTNHYAYDASGSRIKLVKGGTTLTNSVSAGYRIAEVKQGSTTVETYGYDNGGRVTSIARDSKTWNLGYNTTDQMTAATNSTDGTWVTYAHDASGRRTFSTNNATVVRKFLVAPTPGTDLESPQLIANAGGTVQQCYVYLGDEPIARFDSGGNPIYYLEDAMGSVVALANDGQEVLATFNYDGFGNVRSQSGSTNAPTGTGGDFRFHGAWLEADSGLYHMRAREYDARMGRFTSRDPYTGNFRVPETLNPYAFANDNPFVYRDPSGRFTLTEITFAQAIQVVLQAIRTVAAHEAKQYAKKKATQFLVKQIGNALKSVLPLDFTSVPLDLLKKASPSAAGTGFAGLAEDFLCKEIGVPGWFWFEPQIYPNGTVADDGFSCSNKDGARNYAFPSLPRPDLVIGTEPPSKNKSWAIVEFKIRKDSFYRAYISPGKQQGQFDAIVNYAEHGTVTHIAMLVAALDSKKYPGIAVSLQKKALVRNRVILILTSVF